MERAARAESPLAVSRDFLVTRTTNLAVGDPERKRAEIREYFHKSAILYESLFECLKNDEAYYVRANPLRHPLIFYYGHTAVFFINKLNVAGLLTERIDPRLESLLAIGVDEMSWDDLDENNYDWPTPAEVKAYRNKALDIVDNFIRKCQVKLPIGWDDPLWGVMMGIEHERIHLETSAVLIRELPRKHVQNHPFWGDICRESGTAPKNELLPVEGGEITLGKRRDNPYYGWDNEYGRSAERIDPFLASKYLVSNQEYAEFVGDGGYSNRKYWPEAGWKWVGHRHPQNPAFWVQDGGKYRLRTMLEVIDMPWDWPVDVNYYESKAFCNWKSEKTGTSIRLPSEAEWYKLRQLLDTDQPEWPKAPGNINLEHYMSACPVNKFAFKGGFYDIIGNAWQWTETAIDGFEGFEVHPAYDDFSTPTFDGKHMIFKGGCWVSTGNYALRESRYAFRRHFLQNSGIRYVEAKPFRPREPQTYETDDTICRNIVLHYGKDLLGVPNYPDACAKICLEHMKERRKNRALDIGCSVGRVSFELARQFQHVDGVDVSARILQTPSNLQRKRRQRYKIRHEGDLHNYREVLADRFDFRDSLQNVTFMQGDACNLGSKYSDYDLVFAGNLIDQLYDPPAFIGTIHERVRHDGLLVLTSGYSWREESTERSKWLGGFKASTGESYTTLDGLKDKLSVHFKLIDSRDVPCVIRETDRTFQYVNSEMTVWARA
jgi:5-histidylcysteine sulfoxide synthase/putative 4-mercaptohistidine N1-methyltranferase